MGPSSLKFNDSLGICLHFAVHNDSFNFAFFEIYRFTFQKAFTGVVKETDDLAGQHELIAETLMEKIYKELHLLHNELKTERRKVGQFSCVYCIFGQGA